jgi:hypothetical protein
MAFGTRKTLCKFRLLDPKPRYSQISSGSVIQPHTNLTEIQRAAELLWRVNIPPSQVSMGFGFYGRAFTLADPSCNTPGCAFSGASTAGVCTGTGGYLAYYEIENILLTNPDILPVYDEKPQPNTSLGILTSGSHTMMPRHSRPRLIGRTALAWEDR